MSSVLYDVPGPKAVARNRVLGALTIAVVLAIIAFVVYRFADSGQFTARKWSVFTYENVWMNMILPGLVATLSAFAIAAVGSIVFGLALAVGRLSDHAWIRIPVTGILELFRAIPVLVLMMLLYYGLPTIGITMEPFVAVVIALVLYNGSVLAEAFRAGIESLPRGQGEAGYAIGMRKSSVLTLILFPQAIRAMMPVIIAQLVVTLKDTSLGALITYPELLYVAKQLMSADGRPIIPAIIVISVIYIALCVILSWLANLAQKRNAASPKVARLEADASASMHDGTVTEVIAAQSSGKTPKR